MRAICEEVAPTGEIDQCGIFGAWVYYFQRATTTQERIIAFGKGLLWPAFLVYALFTFLDKA